MTELANKVTFYISVNRFDSAEKLVRSAIDDYGPMSNLQNLLGLIFHRQSRFPEALKEFTTKFDEAAQHLLRNDD